MADETGITAKIEQLNKKLRNMTADPFISNEDREKIYKKIQKLKRKGVKPKPKKKDIDRTEEYFEFKSGKKDEGYKVMEAAKGGMVKKYMGGGSVHKNKKNMITTKGWGASRKT